MINWTQAGATVVAAFLSSLVEFVEALTVVLAVGVARGWRGALLGSAGAVLVLLLLIAVLGPALTRIPLAALQLVVGALLLLFGMRWLRKAILRAAGVLALHDETEVYDRQRRALARGSDAGDATAGDGGGDRSETSAAVDTLAVATAFKITLLEGIEVVFIVVALGAGGGNLLLPASVGALSALVAVIMLGAMLHRPLARVPENTLKFVVGVLLSAFGTFWFGEAIGVLWPAQDWAILALIAAFMAAAWIAVPLCRRSRRGSGLNTAARNLP